MTPAASFSWVDPTLASVAAGECDPQRVRARLRRLRDSVTGLGVLQLANSPWENVGYFKRKRLMINGHFREYPPKNMVNMARKCQKYGKVPPF